MHSFAPLFRMFALDINTCFYIRISTLRIKIRAIMDAAFLYPDDSFKILEETGSLFPGNGPG